ncbi:MAG: DUF5067 domain-containing protein [Clostridia bacterium]|nr:DUF5067 domain-containing protein [Clostridia bacterium]
MKKIISLAILLLLLGAYCLFALGSGESKTDNQGNGAAQSESDKDSNLGDYKVDIVSCRLAKDYEGKSVVIVKYKFTNNGDKSAAFYTAFDDTVYQNGVGLNTAYILADNANYSSDNQTKEIKPGASLEVEAAFELNDTQTDIEVEVEELFSLDDNVVKKTFSITE